MKQIKVEDAVGTILCHDITQIIPGNKKGPLFRKGHIISQEDIPELLKVGKEHIYVWENVEGMLHENDAGTRIAKAIAGEGISLSEPKEGKVELIAQTLGLLKIHVDLLEKVNCIEQIAVATLHTNRVVKKDEVICGTRVIPLVIQEEKIKEIESICKNLPGIINVKQFKRHAAGIIITGNEVYYGRIEDAFGPVIRKKLNFYGSEVVEQVVVPDDKKAIIKTVHSFKSKGYDLILTTGGMSVDPDDLTPAAVQEAGANLAVYGVPVLPGSMFMLAYLDQTPILGLPGCVMYNQTTVFDLVLPRVLAGERLKRRDLVNLGHGGLCSSCPECRFPDCAFGKGGTS